MTTTLYTIHIMDESNYDGEFFLTDVELDTLKLFLEPPIDDPYCCGPIVLTKGQALALASIVGKSIPDRDKVFVLYATDYSDAPLPTEIMIQPNSGELRCAIAFRLRLSMVVQTMSGQSAFVVDPSGVLKQVGGSPLNEQFARGVVEALDRSRFVGPDDDPELYGWTGHRLDPLAMKRRWLSLRRFIRRTQTYLSGHVVMRRVVSCGVIADETGIILRPRHHEGAVWDLKPLPGVEDVVLPRDAIPWDIARGLDTAFKRCSAYFGRG